MSERARSLAVLALFMAGTLGLGMAIGIANPPGDWYAALVKPGFTPPDWLFPIAWTLIYALVAIAGWRVFAGGSRLARLLWVVQIALNFSWSPAFFGAHRIGAGLGILALLLVTVLAFVAASWRVNRTAALCFFPYAAWVAYATALNLSIWRLN